MMFSMYSIEHKNVVISISTADKRRNHIIDQFGQKKFHLNFLMHSHLLIDLMFIYSVIFQMLKLHQSSRQERRDA